MHAYMVCMGSMGDTLPFVTIGRAMAARGHDVTIVANEYYKDTIEKLGLAFAPSIDRQDYIDFVEKQKGQSDLRSLRDMGEMIMKLIKPVHDLIVDRYIPGETVVCTQGYAMGGESRPGTRRRAGRHLSLAANVVSQHPRHASDSGMVAEVV